MKKSLLLLLTICMILSSCSNTSAPDTSEALQGEGRIEVAAYEILKRSYNDIGDFIELELNLPKLSGDYEGIAEINHFFKNLEIHYEDKLPAEIYRNTSYRTAGKKDGYNISVFYKFETVIDDIISFSADAEYNEGGTGMARFEGKTFNLNTGDSLELSDLFKVEEGEYMNIIFDLVSQMIIDSIENSESDISPYFFDDPYSEQGYEMIRNFNKDDFYLTEDALVICYEKYALCAGAGGPQKFEIPYTSLAGILAVDVESKQLIEVIIDEDIKKAFFDDFAPEDFTGMYSRTNVQQENQGNLKIENQKDHTFDFSLDGNIPANIDQGYGTAVIISPNMAVWKAEDSREVLFWLNEGIITLGYEDADARKTKDSLVSGVLFNDEYAKGEIH